MALSLDPRCSVRYAVGDQRLQEEWGRDDRTQTSAYNPQWDHFYSHVIEAWTVDGHEAQVMEDPSRDRNCHGHVGVAVRPWFRVCSTPLALHCSLTDPTTCGLRSALHLGQ